MSPSSFVIGAAPARPQAEQEGTMATSLVLAETAGVASHVLRQDDTGQWRYGERQCFSDQCEHIQHRVWHWQDATPEDAEEIQALFAARCARADRYNAGDYETRVAMHREGIATKPDGEVRFQSRARGLHYRLHPRPLTNPADEAWMREAEARGISLS